MRPGKPEWNKAAWAGLLLVAWGGALFLFLKTNGHLTAEELLKYEPEDKLLAALGMLGLFALKSVDFLLHSGVLYAVSGIVFRPYAAIALDMLGILVMAAIPYRVGTVLGAPAAARIMERQPKLKALEKTRKQHEFLFVLLGRVIGIPLAAAGVYMGAVGLGRRNYYLASAIGMAPTMLCFTLMGESAGDPTSPKFIAAVLAYLLVTALALGISVAISQREKYRSSKERERA